MFERLWRNRHTRTFEGRVPQGVRVQVSSAADKNRTDLNAPPCFFALKRAYIALFARFLPLPPPPRGVRAFFPPLKYPLRIAIQGYFVYRFFDSRLAELVYQLLHFFAVLFEHFTRYMAVSVEGKSDSRMSEIRGQGFYVTAALKRQQGIGVP